MQGLNIENLSMVYELPDGSSVEALKNISFDLKAGEFLTILGPSGCGKTTLLNILAGFLAQTSGKAIFNGKEIIGPSSDKGVVFQQGALFEWMSVENNVGFGPSMSDNSNGLFPWLSVFKNIAFNQKLTKETKERVNYWLEIVGLSGFGPKAVYELSGGMQQRVALARCLANTPDLILMDEPLGALDALTREKMQSLLLKLWKETGKTIVLITHSVEEALMLGERLFVMAPRPGRLEKQYRLPFADQGVNGNSRDIKTQANFIETREEILSMIWGMEEEIMGKKE